MQPKTSAREGHMKQVIPTSDMKSFIQFLLAQESTIQHIQLHLEQETRESCYYWKIVSKLLNRLGEYSNQKYGHILTNVKLFSNWTISLEKQLYHLIGPIIIFFLMSLFTVLVLLSMEALSNKLSYKYFQDRIFCCCCYCTF